ncbi:MAG: beta-hydroxyacyl-ACP dehydratase [Desulfobacterales bacterium]|nr:beta-hydroxyacyl-ACP dehydratase [Desulfobacterales bacterium]
MLVDKNIIAKVLASVPQKEPFRFIDDILELNHESITATYRFKSNEYFYQGHFAGNPITPGVILIETMAQAGVVALGIYLLLHNGGMDEPIHEVTPLFACVDQVEFFGIVKPGEQVHIIGQKIYFRKGTIKSNVRMHRENGELVCRGKLTGTGVKTHEK